MNSTLLPLETLSYAPTFSDFILWVLLISLNQKLKDIKGYIYMRAICRGRSFTGLEKFSVFDFKKFMWVPDHGC